MILPAPRPGLVVRYGFLWSDEADRGRTEGRKDRPVAIIVAARQESGGVRVVVAPVTHAPPNDATASVPIPAEDAIRLGLDGDAHWIRLDELNVFGWPGFDLRPIPGRGGEVAYGMLPRTIFEAVRAGILARRNRGTGRTLDRD